MWRSLQRSAVILKRRRAAADDHDRRTLEIGVRNRRHAIGHARTGRDECDADLATQQRMRGRHVHGSALVPHVDDRRAARGQAVPDRLDVPALQAENARRPPRGDEARDPLRNGGSAGHRRF